MTVRELQEMLMYSIPDAEVYFVHGANQFPLESAVRSETLAIDEMAEVIKSFCVLRGDEPYLSPEAIIEEINSSYGYGYKYRWNPNTERIERLLGESATRRLYLISDGTMSYVDPHVYDDYEV